MKIRIENPTGRNTPAHVVSVGECEFYFSYQTLIGYAVPGLGRRRIANLWGPTTGRHFRELGLAESPMSRQDDDVDAFASEAYEAVIEHEAQRIAERGDSDAG